MPRVCSFDVDLFAGKPAMLTVAMAARELSVSTRTVGRMMRRYRLSKGKFGLGPEYHVGGRTLLASQNVQEYLEASRVEVPK